MRHAITVMMALGLLAGCEKQDESVAKQAGDKVGKAVTDFATGIGHGVNKGLEVSVELSEALLARGITKTISKNIGIETGEKGFAVYLIATQPLNARLLAKALNQEGLEIGRSAVKVEFGTDDAKYVTFKFEPEMDAQTVHRYHIDLIADLPPGEDARPSESTSGPSEGAD